VAGAAWSLGGALRDFHPELVHAHNVRATFTAALARMAGLPRRPPLVSTFHGVPPAELPSSARVLRMASRTVCVSTGLADQLAAQGYPRSRLSVVGNALPERATGDAPGPERSGEGPVVSIVGRLVAQKAHHRFLDAAAIVARARPDARFLVVGDGPLRVELERRSDELGLGAAVTFTGQRPDGPALIAGSDLLVFSSDWEGLSMAALEALSAGVPVVSTDVAGMTELLAGGAGMIVAEPTPQALARGIETLLGDPGLRERMGAAGRRVVEERFSLRAMLSGYDDAYESVSGARPLLG
jgi:glycosyltransferase involved in cell wall biosynthesis